ncbi:DNA-binding transcriptional regulator, MarR family [Amycolatopsis arida]|uniref:DNA-binding transcriptional regulator, MarR family n=1 Tax=Amycolatopsis arida TaxID=587909 RepID=A0A1I5T5G5_9PSEU|nr:MarR family transcriptional regulator [Amycolatopsis arida]TDX96222.1 DNA-binding MarR family transcriptional regulator [Amycolatopsis arida]SFP78279.1 DNA-binding transcriptional regulator, MarR family [Amycolatopsis arida]
MTPATTGLAHFTEAELATADELGHQLVRLMRLMTKAKAQVAKRGPDGLERAAFAILFTLIHEGPQRTGQLAETLHSDISTISRQSSALVQHGLVERHADPEDGRASLLAPTPEGIRVFEENRQLRNRWLATLLADWPDADRRTLTVLIDRFNSGIEARSPELAAPGTNQHCKGDHQA